MLTFSLPSADAVLHGRGGVIGQSLAGLGLIEGENVVFLIGLALGDNIGTGGGDRFMISSACSAA